MANITLAQNVLQSMRRSIYFITVIILGIQMKELPQITQMEYKVGVNLVGVKVIVQEKMVYYVVELMNKGSIIKN